MLGLSAGGRGWGDTVGAILSRVTGRVCGRGVHTTNSLLIPERKRVSSPQISETWKDVPLCPLEEQVVSLKGQHANAVKRMEDLARRWCAHL